MSGAATLLGFGAAGAGNDPYFGSVVALVGNYSQPDGVTVFVDQSNSQKLVTPSGSAQFDTAQAPTPLTSSILCDGTGDGLGFATSTDFAFGTGDYTIEGWFRFDSPSVGGHLWDNRSALTNGTQIDISTNATNFIVFWSNTNKITAAAPSRGAWHYFAVCRASGTTTLYLDGTSAGSAADANDHSVAVAPHMGIGYDGLASWDGWLGPFRVTKGVARYTANFTTPTLPLFGPLRAAFEGTPLVGYGTPAVNVVFTDRSENGPTSWLWEKNDGSGYVNFAGTPTNQNPTESLSRGIWSIRLTANGGASQQKSLSNYITQTESLLCHFDGTNGSTTFTDSSAYALVPTAAGSVNISTTAPQFGTGACLFNGTTDKLTWSHATAFTFAGDFSFLFWIKTTQTTRGLLWGNVTAGAQNFGIELNPSVANSIVVSTGNSFTAIITKTSAGIADGAWHYVALTRASGTVRLYLDGVSVGSASNSVTWGDSGGKVVGSTFAGNFYNGRMDELRIVNGNAVYSGASSFTPPAQAWP